VPVYPLPGRAVRALRGLFEYGEIREKKRHGAGSKGHRARSKGHRA
jgi:acyl-CoA synthetase (NDP forming)